MLQMICPKCGGPAIKLDSELVSCGVCGDFSHGFQEQMQVGRSLLDQLPEPAPERKRLDLRFPDAEMASFPSEQVSVRLPRGFQLEEDCDFQVTAGRALEYFFSFLEAYGAIPEVTSTVHGGPRDIELLSSHAYKLDKLAGQSELSKIELCELGLELYTLGIDAE